MEERMEGDRGIEEWKNKGELNINERKEGMAKEKIN